MISAAHLLGAMLPQRENLEKKYATCNVLLGV